MTIGDAIQYYRKKQKITQKQFAKIIGKSCSTIQKYEIGIVVPHIDILQKIAGALDVSIEQITNFSISRNSFGLILKKLRKDKGMTQKQLGEVAGCTAREISMYEAEERKPSIKTTQALAHALSVPVGTLFGEAQDGCEKEESTNGTQNKLEIKIEINGYNPDLFIEKLDKYLATLSRKDT